MKSSRARVRSNTREIGQIVFEDQRLTAFAGLMIFHRLFRVLDLKASLGRCFRHLTTTPIFGHARVFLLLVVHLLLGFRELRQLRYYAEDPMVARVLGLSRLPDVATVSRTLSSLDARSVESLAMLNAEQVCERLAALALEQVTLDFDGSVVGTRRHAEGTAVGFNPRRKGQRSYYPQLCTVAQTGQVLAVLPRPGNVHDSNGARAFIGACIERVRQALPEAGIEVRMDSAFFSDELVSDLEALGVGYSLSVAFEHFAELKERIEQRRRWSRIDRERSAFERRWAPKSWSRKRRFVFVRQQVQRPIKGPLQLDLFQPREQGFDFKVIVTNKAEALAHLVAFHDGRGAQEGLFAELKADNGFAYVPTRTWLGNRTYMLAAVFAHNLTRELQMRTHSPTRSDSSKRTALWDFRRLDTLRQNLLHRAGRIIRPQGRLTLSMNANNRVQKELLQYLEALDVAA